MNKELVQKFSDKVSQLHKERAGYEQTHAQCEQELGILREELEQLLQDYNGAVTLLNGSAYSVGKIDEELEAYNQYVGITLYRKPPLELTVKEDY